MPVRPDRVRALAGRCHLGRKRHSSYGPGTAIDYRRVQQMGGGRSTDSGWAHSSPLSATAHRQAPARRKPGNNPKSNYPPKRKRTPAFATCRLAGPVLAAHREAGRNTVSSLDPRVLRELAPSEARRVVGTLPIGPGKKTAVQERKM